MHTHHIVNLQKSVLVTGASGLLGRDVMKAFDRAGWRAVGTALTRVDPPSIVKLDLLNVDSIPVVIDDVKPDVIVHCAANRFPDSVEADPETATALNVDATRSLATEAFKRGILLIYISTDYVFSGQRGEAPYTTNSKVNPPNKYGQTKADGERMVLEATSTSLTMDSNANGVLGLVLRVPLLYGHCEDDGSSQSAVHAIVSAVRKAREQKVEVDDWSLRFPTATEDVGRVIKDIAEVYTGNTRTSGEPSNELPRILHFSAKERYTKYEMARFFAEEVLGISMNNIRNVNPDTDPDVFKVAVNRPFDTQLDTMDLEKLGIDTSTLDFKGWW